MTDPSLVRIIRAVHSGSYIITLLGCIGGNGFPQADRQWPSYRTRSFLGYIIGRPVAVRYASAASVGILAIRRMHECSRCCGFLQVESALLPMADRSRIQFL